MATKDRSELKGYFVRNATPSQGDFADLIDSSLNLEDDGIHRESGGPLCITAASQDDAQDTREALGFYRQLSDADPAWVLSLKDPGDGSGRLGFSAGRPGSPSDLFIHESGHVSIGTLDAQSPLTVQGGARVHSLGVGAEAPEGEVSDPGGPNLSSDGLQVSSGGQVLLQGTAPVHYKVFDNSSAEASGTTVHTEYATADWILLIGGFWMVKEDGDATAYRGSRVWPYAADDGKWAVSIDLVGPREARWHLSVALINRKLFSAIGTLPAAPAP